MKLTEEILKGCEIKEERLNLCCGFDVKEGWVNADLYPINEKVEKVDMLDLPSEWRNRFDEILVSQSLEHVGHQDVPNALRNILKVLKPGGKCVFIVPDLDWGCEVFFSAKDNTELKIWAFMTIFGRQDRPGEFHKCGFTFGTFNNLLRRYGFVVEAYMATWTNNQRQILAQCTKKEASNG